MRVALVSTFPPQSCGIGTYTQYLSDALIEAGRDVSILTEFGSAPAVRPGLTVRPCFDGKSDYVGDILEAVAACRPDVVHIQHEYGIFGFDERFPALLDALRSRGVPSVVTLHTVHTALSIDLGCADCPAHRPPPNFDVERYQRRICESAERVVVHQERTTRQVLVRQGTSPFRVAAIPHGTMVPGSPDRTAARHALGLEEADALVVALGYFEPAKNVLTLLQSLSALRARHPRLRVLIGGHIRHATLANMACMEECRATIDRHGLADIVTIIPRELTEAEMTTTFTAADVACFAYDEDTRSASGALHRALGCGTVIAASRIAKFDELSEVADELLVSPRSPVALANLLGRLLGDADFRADMGARLSILAERTRWPLIAERHSALYAGIMSSAAVDPVLAGLAPLALRA